MFPFSSRKSITTVAQRQAPEMIHCKNQNKKQNKQAKNHKKPQQQQNKIKP